MIYLILATVLLLNILGASAALIAKLAGITFLKVAIPMFAALLLYGLVAYPFLLKKSRKTAVKSADGVEVALTDSETTN